VGVPLQAGALSQVTGPEKELPLPLVLSVGVVLPVVAVAVGEGLAVRSVVAAGSSGGSGLSVVVVIPGEGLVVDKSVASTVGVVLLVAGSAAGVGLPATVLGVRVTAMRLVLPAENSRGRTGRVLGASVVLLVVTFGRLAGVGVGAPGVRTGVSRTPTEGVMEGCVPLLVVGTEELGAAMVVAAH
jgi:hypothetical protein